MKVTVFVDTTSNEKIIVCLMIDKKRVMVDQPITKQRAQVVLPLIEQLLTEHDLKLADITGIEVNPGPGSFTGIRVGLTIANTLGFLLKVPVNGMSIGELVEAKYV